MRKPRKRRTDTERLDWLEVGNIKIEFHLGGWRVMRGTTILSSAFPKFRQAIDAAMKETRHD